MVRNAREERGLVIAALCKLNRTPNGWLVPSQSGQQIYTVDPVAQTCTCPDHLEAGQKCKHLYAVEFTIKREQEEFMAHYHKRSNIESTNSMVKRKFGDHLRSRTDPAMVNEALCKLLSHNLCVLIQEQHELGIEPVF